jgi:hypothetical protein
MSWKTASSPPSSFEMRPGGGFFRLEAGFHHGYIIRMVESFMVE